MSFHRYYDVRFIRSKKSVPSEISLVFQHVSKNSSLTISPFVGLVYILVESFTLFTLLVPCDKWNTKILHKT